MNLGHDTQIDDNNTRVESTSLQQHLWKWNKKLFPCHWSDKMFFSFIFRLPFAFGQCYWHSFRMRFNRWIQYSVCFLRVGIDYDSVSLLKVNALCWFLNWLILVNKTNRPAKESIRWLHKSHMFSFLLCSENANTRLFWNHRFVC